MGRKGPITLTSLIRSTVVMLALAIVCAAMGMYELRRRSAAGDALREKVEIIAEGSVRAFEAASSVETDVLLAICERLVRSRRIAAVALFDKDGNCLADSAADEQLRSFLKPIRPQLIVKSGHVETLPTVSDTSRFVRTRARLPADAFSGELSLCIIAEFASDTFDSTAGLWQFHLPLACISIAAVFIFDQRTRRRLAAPLRSLSASAESLEDATRATGRDLALISEFSEIAERIESLETDLRCWQRRAEMIERRADAETTRETTRIMRDLQRVKREAWLDSLTGIYNRRFLEEKFPDIFESQRKGRRDLSVMMIDLDNFKKLNDSQGHAAGDAVLRFAGELLKQCLRSEDCAIRYGGDEFIVILPGVCADQANTLAERLLALFAQRVKAMFPDQTPSMTVGIASISRNEPASPAELIACADHALISAKQAGKRRARVSALRGEHFRRKGISSRIQVRASTPLASNL